MPVAALAFLLSIGATWALTDAIGRGQFVHAAVEATFCPAGWELRAGGERTRRSPGAPLRTSATRFRPYCVSPDGNADFCETCSLLAVSPVLLFATLSVGSLLWSVRRKPTALDHLAQLDVALGYGAISREQYDALRREVLANPEMTRARFQAILHGGQGGT